MSEKQYVKNRTGSSRPCIELSTHHSSLINFNFPMTHKLTNKVTLITGSNSGIGQATALLFAREGAKVVIAARNAEKANLTIAQIQQAGGTAAFVGCDVRQAEDCVRAVEFAVQNFGRIDILFNNAGIVPSGTIF
jgi:NAD(P)-dependent dehydrogenase (short-subunit alcohol dehydrogenase family)